MVSTHGLTVLPHTKKSSDHPGQVSQDNQKSSKVIFDIWSPPEDELTYDLGFWRKNLCSVAGYLRTQTFWILLILNFESAFSGVCAIWNFVNLFLAVSLKMYVSFEQRLTKQHDFFLKKIYDFCLDLVR
jgi:hypothetical protein